MQNCFNFWTFKASRRKKLDWKEKQKAKWRQKNQSTSIFRHSGHCFHDTDKVIFIVTEFSKHIKQAASHDLPKKQQSLKLVANTYTAWHGAGKAVKYITHLCMNMLVVLKHHKATPRKRGGRKKTKTKLNNKVALGLSNDATILNFNSSSTGLHVLEQSLWIG